MSVQLHPDIETLDKESLCYSIYAQLYHNFFNAQQKKDDEHPYGIEEGDETSLRLKNTAYGFASAIAGAVTGEGGSGSGGLLLDYLKKSGGDMTGKLSANYGFEAGIGNTRILETYSQDITDPEGVVTAIEYGIRITGNLKVGGDSLHIGGRQLLRYDADKATATINASHIDFLDATVHSKGAWIIGDEDTGISISPTRLAVGGQDVYHRGNANTDTVDWTMRDGMVRRNLTVRGSTVMDGGLKALQGVELGDKGKCLLSFSEEDVALGGFLSFLDGFGIRIGDVPVLLCTDKDKIQFGSIGGDLLLGGDHTPKIRLFSGISDVDGECLMLSPYGKACFPGSLTVRHNYGADLLSSYRVDTSDEGIVIHKRLRMGTAEGFMFTGDRERVSLSSEVIYEEEDVRTAIPHSTDFSHRPSVSCYAPQNRHSESFHIVVDKIKTDGALQQELAGVLEKAGYDTSRLADGKKLVLITGHRRENFGDGFISMCTAIKDLTAKYPYVDFVYPMHLNPNVRKPIHEVFGENLNSLGNMFFIEPLEYLSFVFLMEKVTLVLTDSGGIQEEAPGLGKPVLVMRDTTERPEALDAGTVKLVGTDYNKIVSEVSILLDDASAYEQMSKAINPYGDGKACMRITQTLNVRL